MLQTIRHLLSLIRFSHTLFALPFALLAMLMAGFLNLQENKIVDGDPILYQHVYYYKFFSLTIPSFSLSTDHIEMYSVDDLLSALPLRSIFGILLCMITARSAAMAFNRLVDRKIDAKNPRTEGRHIPAGLLSVTQVTTFTLLSSIGFIASTLLFLPNKLPLYLSLPVLAWLCGYSYAKRFTSLAHYWLGIALGLSPLAAWIAIRGEAVMANPIDLLPPIVLAGAVMAWVGGFDILYACQDYEYDRGAKLRSIPTKLGVRGALRLAACSHAIAVLLFALLPLVYPPFGMIYWLGIAAVAGLLIYEHSLVRPDDLDRVNLAFFHVNAVISIGLLVVGTLDLML